MKARHAFSLLELLVVLAIIGLLAALAVPAFNSVNRGREVELSGVQLSDALGLARQNAISKNKPSEVWFLTHPGRTDSAAAIRSVQVFEISDDGSPRPLAKPVRLPDSLVITDQSPWSSIFGSGTLQQLPATNLPGVGSVSAIQALRFQASGRTALPNLSSNYFLTVLPAASSQTNNFVTIQIDALTGRTRTFRP